jgi:PAS domain S-box-containing protein
MTRREARRSAQLAEVTAAHEGLTARLADMEAARRDVAERTRNEQAAAVERQGQLEVRLKQAAEAQERLDGQLSEATSACDVLTVRLSAAEAAAKEAHDEKEIQLDDSAKRFDQAPLAVVRCTRDGVPTQANRAFGVLTGYQTDDLIAESARRAFEMSDELSGLIQRCLQTGAVETIETRWKRKDGGHLHVRVSAFATTQGVDIAAEDISSLRSLQARLDRAQRMEAVGRLASEVAVTCGNLLRDVSEDGQRWLATLDSDAAVRERGTALLRDVTRAASFLRQLTADGDEQADRREPVDLPRLLRDMEPVLKRVAGERIKLVLPKTASRGSSPMHVDLMADRVERLLVNVASYGRERMPCGGRLIFDLTTVVVDQQFVARYPNVRRGPHALITVTEVGDPSRTGGTLALRDVLAEARAGTSVLEKPGLDLGTLQAIVRECGGHLWMEIQPPGQMVAKIHLPLRVGDEPVHSIAATKQTRLGRSVGRLFHH